MAKHAQSVHQAQAHWEGGLTDGKGRLTGSSSGQLAEVPMTWNARTGGDNTLTSPEELLAAAHAACFAMALAYELQGRKAEPRSLDVSAAVGFDLDGDIENGGFVVGLLVGYSRMLGDARRTPYTSIRGSADQFYAATGVGYIF